MQSLLMCGGGDPNMWNMQTLRCGICKPLHVGCADTNHRSDSVQGTDCIATEI